MEEKDKELLLAALKKLQQEIEEEEDDLNRLMKMTERFAFNYDQLGLRVKQCLQEVQKRRRSLYKLLRRLISMLMDDRDRDHDQDHDHDEANFERIIRDNVEKIRLLLVKEVTLFSNLENSTVSIAPQDHQDDDDDDDDDDDVVAMDGGDKEEKEAIESSVDSNGNIISESSTEEEEEVMQKRSSWELRMEEIQDLHQSCRALRVKLERDSIEAAAGPGPGPGPSSSAMSNPVIVSDDKDPDTEVKTEDRTEDDPEKKTPSTTSSSSE